jgi:hypothetical protein
VFDSSFKLFISTRVSKLDVYYVQCLLCLTCLFELISNFIL